ncbi:HlyD family efflux transporter periplasmic adaptor subunit [bacterium]|nr:HlyD family efflux transporter periplasmic adaptor subunit [Chlamydiota bacterium]NDD99809.1 HlyD family efflux transporter periplasmic adaptor subunit [bacterium]
MTLPPQETPPQVQTSRNRILLGVSLGLSVLTLLFGLYWFFYARFYKFTDDAYVAGNTVMVTAQVPGIITTIYAQDADFVTKGTPLVQIDPTDHQIALNALVNDLGNQVRDVAKLFFSVETTKADILAQKALLNKKIEDFERRKALIPSNAVSQEDFMHSKYDMENQEANVLALENTLLGLEAQTENTTIETHPKVLSLIQKVLQAYINLKRCTLYAPVTGVVAQRTVQVGKWVAVTEPLLSVVPLDQMWIEANFKETQLSRVRVGQPVKIHSDFYGHSVEYSGVVAGVGGGTGSAFSVLPPQNATGNWIKIVQRVPVRIDLSRTMLEEFPLRVGLSMLVTVDTTQDQGSMTAQPRDVDTIRFATDIYANEEAGALELIRQTIETNLSLEAKDLESK